MKNISKIASSIAPSATLAVSNLAAEMKASGLNVISFGAGEPDFATPQHIKQAAIDAINADKSHYSATSGIVELRKAICNYIQETFGLTYAPNEICVSSGAKHILFVVFKTILDPGDEVILPAPYWVTYAEAVRMCGAEPVILNTTEENRFKMTPEMLEAAITDKTKCVILTNPSNPTGVMYSEAEVRALAEVIEKHDLFVISDEIYATLVYSDEPFFSIASVSEKLKELTIVVNGVSKTYAMTGWRIGYAAADKKVISAMSSYLSHSTGNASNAAQYAAVQAYAGSQDEVKAMKEQFALRREYMLSRVREIPGVSCVEPDGAFYVFMNVKELLGKTFYGEVADSSSKLSELFLKHGLVATVAGEAFGAPGYLRWSYATSMDNIKEGFDRLAAFVASAE